MGSTNGLLATLDAAWTVHVQKRADVRALIRVLREDKPVYVLFGNPQRHEEIGGRCTQITHEYNGKLPFDTQILNDTAYEGICARLEHKLKDGSAKILYDKNKDD